MTKFGEINLKNKSVSQKNMKGYNIYKSKSEFVFVEAVTAAEAIEKAGINQIYKIEPASVVKKSVFSEGELSEKQG